MDGGGERPGTDGVTTAWDPSPPWPGGPPTAWPTAADPDGPADPAGPIAAPSGGWISPPPLPPSGPGVPAPVPVLPPLAPQPEPAGPWRAVLALVVVAALVAVGLVGLTRLGGDGDDAVATDEPPGTGASSTTIVGTAPRPTTTLPPTTVPPTTLPPPTTTAPPVRRAPEVPAPAENGPHLYISTEADGDPVTWDPCDPVRFVVNSRLAPPGAPEILAEAMARVTAATGLVFADAGPSDEAPPVGPSRPLRDPARYGEGWSPVLISWTDQTEVPELTEFDGLAWVQWVAAGGGEAVHVTGNVELDVRDVAEMLSRGEREYVVALVMHELGHLVGLAHVPDVTEVMTDDPGGVVALDWGAGDRYGLAALGRGECDPGI